MLKILIGGSPCTFWSIAQKNHRETEADGIGWELFKNYLVAKEKFKPDIFLYENNVSAAKAIKDQIKEELKVNNEYNDARYIEINSALVSAQNRKRFYVHNCGDIEQPEDRRILLKDVLESKPVEAVQIGYRNRREADGKLYRRFETSGLEKSNALTTVQTDSMAATPVRVGTMPQNNGNVKDNQATRIYDINGKSTTLSANGGGWGAKTGLYAEPVTGSNTEQPIYEVKDGKINIKGKEYPIKLLDGKYIIRKLTPIEAERLQTLPDNYTAAVSNAQRYKGLGNGWTAEVIIHILNGALKDVPKDEEIIVLSMYDGIATGRYCLDKMGFTNVTYFAYEIDKYAKQIAMSNYPDIKQMGDAFQVRNPDWTIGY